MCQPVSNLSSSQFTRKSLRTSDLHIFGSDKSIDSATATIALHTWTVSSIYDSLSTGCVDNILPKCVFNFNPGHCNFSTWRWSLRI